MGRTLAVACVTLGLVAWLAQDRCLLAVREMWDGQPRCEAGEALGREAELQTGVLPLLVLLSSTATVPERDMTKS